MYLYKQKFNSRKQTTLEKSKQKKKRNKVEVFRDKQWQDFGKKNDNSHAILINSKMELMKIN